MKYDVKCSRCGDDEILDLGGKVSDREWMIKNFNDHGLCDSCKEIERAEQLTILEKESEKLGLPELTGSEKQIAWAMKLRMEMIGNAEALIKRSRWIVLGMDLLSEEEINELLLKEYVKEDETLEVVQAALMPVRDTYKKRIEDLKLINAETSAKWFIENR